MFLTSFLIASLSYLLFFFGLIGFFYKNIITATFLIWLVVILVIFFVKIKSIRIKSEFYHLFSNPFFYLLLAQFIINLIGALGPELSFDALWYHLTLPKIFLQEHKIFYVPGGLLYYSAMPKLTEMLYAAALSVQGEILAKIIHLIFGLLTVICLYLYSIKRFGKKIALIASVIFYSNLVVGWQSTTAYIDLSRTFYEFLAFLAFVKFAKNKRRAWLIASAFMLGFAISTKILAAGSIILFLVLIFLLEKNKKEVLNIFKNILLFLIFCIVPVVPWLLFSYFQTGNPLYPLFSGYPIEYSGIIFNPINFAVEIFILFAMSSDPISPLYLVFLPIGIFYYRKLAYEAKIAIVYFAIALVVWYFTPRTGGGRFILPYLPVASLILVEIFVQFKNRYMVSAFLVFVVAVSFFSILYRAAANSKYFPVIFGREIKRDFLAKYLNFSFGDFYDIDGYFDKTITNKDMVLVYGIHNLYYINFPFMHESFIKKGTKFNYLLLGDGMFPGRFSNAKLYYENKVLNVKLYGRKGKGSWQY